MGHDDLLQKDLSFISLHAYKPHVSDSSFRREVIAYNISPPVIHPDETIIFSH